MSFFGGGGGGSAPSIPAPAPAPAAPAPAPVVKAKEKEKLKRGAPVSTILTGSQGLKEDAPIKSKTLLGA